MEHSTDSSDAEPQSPPHRVRVRLLERRVEEAQWSPNQLVQHTETFQKEALEKEKIIKTLESEVETQRQQRLSDARQVEAKAARIKDWVTNKLRELEEQNAHLREQNAYCNGQMELLRARLEQMQAMSHTRVRESTAEDSSLGSFEGEPGRSDESLSDVPGYGGVDHQQRRSGNRARSNIYGGNLDPLYAQVDSHRKTRSRTGRDLRTRSADPSALALAGLSRVSRADSGSVDLETPLELSPKSPLELAPKSPPEPLVSSPKSPLEVLDEALDRVMPSTFSLPVAPPRGRQKKEETAAPDHTEVINKKVIRRLMSDEQNDYSEIFTPTAEEGPLCATSTAPGWEEADTRADRGSGSEITSAMSGTSGREESLSAGSSLRTVSAESGLSAAATAVVPPPPPPPPPLHRVPSWEDRIYLAASNQIVLGAQIDLSNNNNAAPSASSATAQLRGAAGRFAGDINVPVYATVKGRASQIRSMPVTGESSCDSSDAEDHHHQPRDTSFDSDGSNDYAVPPDASQLLATSNNRPTSCFLDSPRKSGEKVLEKTGYLTKLGGKLKSWHKRYFVLKNGNLSYWKSQHDVERKPQGVIHLTETCRVSRTEGSSTFEICVGDRTHHLSAESLPLAEDWVRVLQNVIQRNALRLLLSKEGQTPTLQAWLDKVKHGHSRRCWCVLIGKMLIYFKTPNDQNPLGQINMRDARVEEVEHISDSDSDGSGQGADEERTASEPTIGIFPNHIHQGPTYLIFPNKSEQEQWLYQLTVVSGGDPNAGTQFEQLIQRLMEADGDPASELWRHPLLVHSKEPLTAPLTTFTSESLQAEALKLFKSVQLFCSVLLNSSGIDYHVVLAQNAFQQCLNSPELQPELLAILAKQTGRQAANRHGVQSFLMNATSLFTCDSSAGAAQRSPLGGPTTAGPQAGSSRGHPAATTFMQAWMMMAMAVSIFVPKSSKMLWFLRTHFNRCKDSKSETGKYAAYCASALERSVANGPRHAKPSRMEVLSILLKNPHHHSLPHALPVHMLNGTYQVVGFDGSTTMDEFTSSLTALIGCRSADLSGFAIFSDDPIEAGVDHSLAGVDKVCDVLSRWETALRERGSGKFENRRAIRFTFKNRLHWKRSMSGETEKEKLLLCYQVSQQIIEGRFPVNKELALELAALMAQIHHADLPGDQMRAAPLLTDTLEQFYPARYHLSAAALGGAPASQELAAALAERWQQLAGKPVSDCVRILLTCTRKWSLFGATLFDVKRLPEVEPMWLAVGEEGVALLEHSSLQLIAKFPYASIVTFGGCQDDFMLVVMESGNTSTPDIEHSERLLFSAAKIKILEMTLLMADHMNQLGQLLPSNARAHSRSTSRSRPSVPPATPRPSDKERISAVQRTGSSVSQIGKRSRSATRKQPTDRH